MNVLILIMNHTVTNKLNLIDDIKENGKSADQNIF